MLRVTTKTTVLVHYLTEIEICHAILGADRLLTEKPFNQVSGY